MINYIIRRLLYSIPILIGVNIIVFLLFFVVNTPEDIARAKLGNKYDSPAQVDTYLREKGLDLPKIYNPGWKREGDAIFGNQKVNQQKISITHAGEYQIVVQPEIIPENQADAPTNNRNVSFKLYDTPSLNTETTNYSLNENIKLEFSKNITTSTKNAGQLQINQDTSSIQTYQITISNNGQLTGKLTNELTFDINFNLDSPLKSNKVVLQYKQVYDSFMGHFTDTLLATKSIKMLWFDFGKSYKDRKISTEIYERMWPSLNITIPALLVGTFINIVFAMLLAMTRGNAIDYWGVMLCVLMMSISSLFYIIGGQTLFGQMLNLTPISGYDPDNFYIRFIILPVSVLIASGVGVNTRFYRTLFLEEINQDYVRTAKAKGMKQSTVLFVHTLKNAMIPILTSLVVQLPLLLIGSLLIEKFFAIPGLGQYTIDAINASDFSVVQAMVMLGATLYVLGLLLTDISYTLVDPRVRL